MIFYCFLVTTNDAAVAMAEFIAGSVDEFVNMMNDKVMKLGLTDTHFVNVHGLDAENHYSSSYDMAQIARELVKHEKVLDFTSLYEDYLIKPDGSKIWLVNTNKLVRFFDGVDGLKTGYTSTAKYCLTATAKKNDIRFISVVMGVDSSEHRSYDTTNLLNYGFNTYKLNKLIDTNEIIDYLDIKNGIKNKIPIYVEYNVNNLVKKNELKEYRYNIKKNSVKAPIKVGDIIGTLEVIDEKGDLVTKVNLVSKEKINKHSFWSLFKLFYKKITMGS